MSKANRCDAVAFFDEFVEAFSTFDGLVVAQRYHQPFIALHSDETAETMQNHSETAEYFQKYLDSYHADGCRSCGFEELEVIQINQSSILATVTWKLYDSKKALVTSWRESYTIAFINSKMQVLTSVDHAA